MVVVMDCYGWCHRIAMVGAMGLLWLLPWDCYGCCYDCYYGCYHNCCHGMTMVATIIATMVATHGKAE